MPEPHLPAAFLRLPLAHRGLHDRRAGVIENSLSAFRAAVAQGYGIEIDIQPSHDGEAMVFHDALLDRLTGAQGAISSLSAAVLGKTLLTGGQDTIPTLAEVLAAVDGKVPLLIEIKDQDGALGPNVGALERRVCAVLAGYRGPAAVMSFNPHSVAACQAAAPDLLRGLTSCAFLAEDWPDLTTARRVELARLADFDTLGAAFISHDRKALSDAPVAALKARGVPALCWTIRTPAEEAAARKFADNITFEGYLPARPRA